MKPLEFLHSEAVQGLLARASAGAGVPLSVHYVERNQEGPRIVGWGQCGACRHVQSLPGGGLACRLSRSTAANMALRQKRPMPFVCHLGLACVSAPLLPGEQFVMTLGPFCPMEEQRSLEADLLAGFSSLLGQEVDALPVSLDDLHRSPAAAIPAIAEWTMEALRVAWARAQELESEEPVTEEAVKSVTRPSTTRTSPRGGLNGGTVQAIVAALAGGSFQEARALMQGDLQELQRSGGRAKARRRARIATLVSAALEGLSGSGVSVEPAWNAYPAFTTVVSEGEDDSALLDAAMGLFSFLRRKAVVEETQAQLPNYPELFSLVHESLPEGITLEEVASKLGETPSAISHRLQRKFGMSYSDYVGRIRVDMARRLFRETTLNTAAVGKRIGVPDPSNFARLFRKIEGMSPSAYRKKFGKNS